jgi:hypothetical protein
MNSNTETKKMLTLHVVLKPAALSAVLPYFLETLLSLVSLGLQNADGDENHVLMAHAEKGFDFLSKEGCKRGLNTTGRYTWFLGSLNVFAIYVRA